ncbi:asparagine synthase C-terminal domain-containing protein [Phenylobacterium sp.]|uniref:asparagine synthase C-terminal domain-containing protein n=1 Tax=Phenylobacterium sp. TaxID=1871053 RepID=UPI002F3FBAAF
MRLDRLEFWTWGAVPAPAVHLPGLGAVVIGRLYRRGGLANLRPGQGGPPASARAVARRLVDDGWGAYVAILADPGGAWNWALRDPSGAVDALTWIRDGLRIVASGVEDLPAALLPERLGLDWDAIADFVRRPGSLMAHAGLEGLETVTPGDLHRLGGGSATALWRPAAWARAPAPDPIAAVAQLKRAVDLAVGAALKPHTRCAVELSGGFDSAVVTTTAARCAGDRRLTALHLQGGRPESDERRWAELVLAQTGLPAVVLPLEVTRFEEADLLCLARGARPILNAPDVGRDRRAAAWLAQGGAEVLITGKGGDAVFFQHPTPEILADWLAAKGPRGLAGPLARGLARRLRRSLWSVGWEALGALRRRPAPRPAALWGPRLRAAPAGPAHPWLADLDGLPPAKRSQIAAVVTTQAQRGITRFGRIAEVAHPLLAQPVLEAALAIPVWRLAPEGRERGLARDLFADRVPQALRLRRSKGELSALFAQTVAANLEVLRPYLLDGSLSEAGVLDRVALDAALDPDALMQGADAGLILWGAAVEAFVRHWQTRVPDSAAAPRRWPVR